MTTQENNSTDDSAKKILESISKSQGKGVISEENVQAIVNVLDDKFIKNLLTIHDLLEVPKESGQRRDCISLCMDILTAIEESSEADSEEAKELMSIIKSPYFRCLIEAHDNITYETYKSIPSLPNVNKFINKQNEGPPIRVVGLTNNPKEPLGITLGKHSDNCIYIRRILHGTMVEKQGLLNVGDVIRQINGEPVGEDPKEVQEKLLSCKGDVTLKVIPANKDTHGVCQVFFRCHFDYDPTQDDLFLKNETGISFKRGDIIEVNDQSDNDWWQACHLEDPDNVGLVPSLRFEQTRRANSSSKHKQDTKGLGGAFKKKNKIMYRTSENKLLDCLDVRLYEEVTRMPPVERKLIVLVGAQGVGRRSLKNKLLTTYPDRYQDVTRDTSREPREAEVSGKGYYFRARDEMMADILSGLYLEWGESNGSFYGTKLDAIRDIIQNGKTCIVDTDPSALKLLKTAEFMPLIVFIEAPKIDILVKNNRKDSTHKQFTTDQLKETIRESTSIYEKYHHYFDLRVCNEDLDKTYTTLREHIDKLSSEPQWVPINWVY